MKIVAGVDWSDAAFAAIEQLGLLYQPTDVTLVHGVDLGLFEYPIVAEAANLQGYDIFRKSMFEAGCESLDRAATMLPNDIPKPRQLCEFRKPARFLLDTATAMAADLIVVGTHDHSRVAELVLTSVSHRVLLHAMQPTLLVKGRAKPIRRVLVAIEGRDDGRQICRADAPDADAGTLSHPAIRILVRGIDGPSAGERQSLRRGAAPVTLQCVESCDEGGAGTCDLGNCEGVRPRCGRFPRTGRAGSVSPGERLSCDRAPGRMSGPGGTFRKSNPFIVFRAGSYGARRLGRVRFCRSVAARRHPHPTFFARPTGSGYR
jgi:nucleotide-binding universal stress UspA family protein